MDSSGIIGRDGVTGEGAGDYGGCGSAVANLDVLVLCIPAYKRASRGLCPSGPWPITLTCSTGQLVKLLLKSGDVFRENRCPRVP